LYCAKLSYRATQTQLWTHQVTHLSFAIDALGAARLDCLQLSPQASANVSRFQGEPVSFSPHHPNRVYPLVGEDCNHLIPWPLIGQKSLGVTWMGTSTFNAFITSLSSTRLSIDDMVDEQEIAGASNRAEDAPSLHASRTSERVKKPTQRWTESRLQRTPPKPPPRSRKRKREIPIYNDGDLATLSLTQIETQPSQGTVQEGTQQVSREKRVRKSTKKSSQNESTIELW
jgi:hypothetical protein